MKSLCIFGKENNYINLITNLITIFILIAWNKIAKLESLEFDNFVDIIN